ADQRLMPVGYYALHMPRLLRADAKTLNMTRRRELDYFGNACLSRPELARVVPMLFDRILPHVSNDTATTPRVLDVLNAHGFDRELHEQIRADMKIGRIGLMQNRLPASSTLRDVDAGDVVDATATVDVGIVQIGRDAIASGAVAVVSLAGGAGSRWTQGAGVVKALHPFAKFAGRHRTFVDVHIAKSRQIARCYGAAPIHVFTTSYLTDEPLHQASAHGQVRPFGYTGQVLLSRGRSVGLRFIPMTRDLRFAWEETPHQLLDEQAQKMRQSVHAALINWARSSGEGADYTDNLPHQCMHPVGHWFELPNMMRNGTLAHIFRTQPQVKYLMMHNIDTLGAIIDPAILGLHIASGRTLSFEVIARRIDDRGGGLARVDDQVRLVEGLAMPRVSDEFLLRYYNTLTNWIDIDALLTVFGLTRSDILHDAERVTQAVRNVAQRMPTYVTIKDVKKRWGNGQEDVYPVAQFEKLWGDMTSLPEANCGFLHVSRLRGQQLKDQAQLDGWLRDGSAHYVEQYCDWES
ncbi:MAG: UTP--glucose-1-phosphate uridylyltransferase, partial [Roseiflexaceae bacterium]